MPSCITTIQHLVGPMYKYSSVRVIDPLSILFLRLAELIIFTVKHLFLGEVTLNSILLQALQVGAMKEIVPHTEKGMLPTILRKKQLVWVPTNTSTFLRGHLKEHL